MANKLVDAGEVYLVGQYELGTSTPTTPTTSVWLKMIARPLGVSMTTKLATPTAFSSNRSSSREATYLVEKLMHAKWNSERVSQEWFDFDAAQLAQVKLDIVDFQISTAPTSKRFASGVLCWPYCRRSPRPYCSTNHTGRDMARRGLHAL